MKDVKKADQFLQTEGTELQGLLRKVMQLSAIQTKLRTYLHPDIFQYCQVGNYAQGVLTLITANGSVATQIRFQGPDLIRKFKEDNVLKAIREIQCKVRPYHQASPPTPDNTPVQKMNLLSQESANHVRAIAESMTDEKLREAMLKLAKHVKSG